MKNVKVIVFIVLFSTLLLAQTKDSVVSSVDPKAVIEKYIEAIGGKDIYLNIKDRKVTMEAKAQGMELTTVVYQKAPNKLYQIVSVAGMEQIILFDGEKGFQKSAMGTEELTGEALELIKTQAAMDVLVDYDKYGMRYEYLGNAKVNDEDCYKLEAKTSSGASTVEYYSVVSGLKMKEERDLDTPQGTFKQVSEFSDYQEVEGFKIPFKVNQFIAGMSIKLSVTEVEINKGIPDSRFKID